MSADKPMTKTEARAFLRRARDGIRDAETALTEGRKGDLQDALMEIVGAAVHLQDALADEAQGHGPGIAGVVS